MLLERERSALLLIDLQANLMPSIADGPRVTARARLLAAAARRLEVPVLATEQYATRMGGTTATIIERLN